MTSFISQAYRGPQDLQMMIRLLIESRPAERITDYPSLVDLHEILARPQVQANATLWQDAGGQCVGFAIVDDSNNLLFDISPDAADGGLGAQIIAWGVERLRRAKPDQIGSLTLDASCRDDDTTRIALLERHGFARQAVRSLQLIRALDEPIPTPHLPAGFSIRYVTGEGEVESLVALHRAAFGTANLMVEDRLSWMRTPEYDPTLDLVAVAPDGALAAYCMCHISREENARTGRNEGYTDPVATHPVFQLRGLARALLLTGLGLLQQRGIATAVLGTSSDNLAMQQTAMSVGFCVHTTRMWFAKPLTWEHFSVRH